MKRVALKKKGFARKAVKGSIRKKKVRKPRMSASAKKRALWAEFGLTKPLYVRYSGLQGILWYVMSQYVRKDEFLKYGGECVDGCGRKVLDWREADCGHFLSSTKLKTRFIRENLGLQTKFCNSPFMGNDNTYSYGKTINQRYGEGTAERLILLSKESGKELSKDELRAKIIETQRHLKELENTPS